MSEAALPPPQVMANQPVQVAVGAGAVAPPGVSNANGPADGPAMMALRAADPQCSGTAPIQVRMDAMNEMKAAAGSYAEGTLGHMLNNPNSYGFKDRTKANEMVKTQALNSMTEMRPNGGMCNCCPCT